MKILKISILLSDPPNKIKLSQGEDKLVSEMNRKVELSQLALMEKLDALLTLRPPTTPGYTCSK